MSDCEEMPDGVDSKLSRIDSELAHIESELRRLRKRQQILLETKEKLAEEKDLRASEELGRQNWERSNFEWSDRLKTVMNDVFGIQSFRPQQLSAINATMSKNHAIVVMPTGAGKSLCYQLPSLLSEGITVVVSPLISLMEDQVMALEKKSVSAKLMTSTSTKEENNSALNAMTDKNAPTKLLYVTPERFAKSKRFMTKLQKAFAEGRLQRIAIDEVHCCSQWGHDFRPDYKFLGILSSMFPGIPILGLTATATSRVLADVQKMLDIRGCLIIKSSFNRPNLFYQIVPKPPTIEENVNILEKLLKYRYKNQSGIIYAMSVKDCTDITQDLRNRGLKVACYHANMDADQRSSVHTKWSTQYYQAIIATVAFGMGIDKPNVRFVIHHSLSKSMESYYQESGRAGRDGARAECLMMYRMQDIFRISSMVFSSAGSLDHLYGMIKYCLDPLSCRRKIIAQHFDEEWGPEDCNKMCDRCLYDSKHKEIQIENDCQNLYKILKYASENDTKMTAHKIIDSWYKKGTPALRLASIDPPTYPRLQGEHILAFLLANGYLKEDFHYTPYSAVSYIKIGPKSANFEKNKNFQIKMVLRKLEDIDCKTSAPIDLSNVFDNVTENASSKSKSSCSVSTSKRKSSTEIVRSKTKINRIESDDSDDEIVISD